MPGELLEIALGGAPRATRQELGLGEVGTEQLIVTSMGTATEILCKVLKKRRMWKDLSLNFLCRAGHRAEGNGGLVDKVLGAPSPLSRAHPMWGHQQGHQRGTFLLGSYLEK